MAVRIHGLAVLFRFGPKGYPEPADDIELLGDSIETILKTSPGERVHRPTFGAPLKNLIFTNMSRLAAARARIVARRAIEKWEQRVVVDEITFRAVGSTIWLDVKWRPKGNLADARRTSVPFDGGGQR